MFALCQAIEPCYWATVFCLLAMFYLGLLALTPGRGTGCIACRLLVRITTKNAQN